MTSTIASYRAVSSRITERLTLHFKVIYLHGVNFCFIIGFKGAVND
jgi:hypothetical protein